ncbi:MAG TPA: efflux transporter outer membrane subunit [Gemmatimonadales bacterium]|nr:efflux transporter outer membrane subunit [Gemmatimonadales bacterium]
MRRVALFFSISLTAAGCASAPGYRAPDVQVPAAFRETRDTAIAVATTPSDTAQLVAWPDLGDTTLTRLINQLARSNLDVRAAEARVRGARAARTEAALDFAPTVTFAGGYTRQRLSSATFPIGVGTFPDQSIWDGGFDASWELDLFGRVRHNVQAQGAFISVTQEDLRDIQISLTAELARAYFDLRGAQEQLAVATSNAENQRRTFNLTRERLEAGRGTAFDTERAQAQLSSTLASIPSLEARVRQAQYQIGVLVGRSPARVATELERPAPLPDFPDLANVATPDSVVRRRPDVAAAERQLAVERALVGAAKADYLPRITVDGTAGYSAGEFNALGDRGTFRYAVGPVISWPALNLGRIKARVDQSHARESEARAQYDLTVLRALQDVESSLVRYRTARGRLDRLRDAADASERAAGLARLRFTGGVSDFLQVLDAERTQLEAQDQLAQARTDAATAYAALYKALGGSWPTSADGEGKR